VCYGPQVTLLDPVRFPGAIKVFAREICRNDVLNFGRLHWFFPESRLALDLSTDKTLKEARFDRHFVRVRARARAAAGRARVLVHAQVLVGCLVREVGAVLPPHHHAVSASAPAVACAVS
jgi:hypothetical protein